MKHRLRLGPCLHLPVSNEIKVAKYGGSVLFFHYVTAGAEDARGCNFQGVLDEKFAATRGIGAKPTISRLQLHDCLPFHFKSSVRWDLPLMIYTGE
jgi:hypothetical protein